MKDIKKLGFMALFYGSLAAAFIGIVYAYVVFSNTATVTVGSYSIYLSPEHQNVEQNQTAYFTALVTNQGVPVENVTLYLYKNDVLQYANVTASDGTTEFSVVMTDSAATYDFYATLEVAP